MRPKVGDVIIPTEGIFKNRRLTVRSLLAMQFTVECEELGVAYFFYGGCGDMWVLANDPVKEKIQNRRMEMPE